MSGFISNPSGAAPMTGAEIKAAYESQLNTNEFSDAEEAHLAGIEEGAEVNPTPAEIKAAYEGIDDTNAFTDQQKAQVAVVHNGISGLALTQLATAPNEGYLDVVPTAANPMAAVRLADDFIMVRTRSASLAGSGDEYFDEYLFRDPSGFVGVSGGWMLWSHRVYAKGKVTNWFISPRDQGLMPNADFAFRFGNINDAYHSGGEGPDFFYCGFGHGRMDTDIDPVTSPNKIWLNGSTATNYGPVANWPVGTRLFGTSLQFETVFTFSHPSFGAGATNIASANYLQILDNQGLRMVGDIQALVADVAWQDSYATMFPIGPQQATHFKPAGLDAVALLGDGAQKGNWTTTTAQDYQAYVDADPELCSTMRLMYGQPIRVQGGAMAPWAQNHFGRAFFRDLKDFRKLYVFANSSEEALPRTAWAMPVGTVYEWQNRLATHYNAAGPS